MEISVTNEDLSRLNQLEAVTLVRELVQADADESGISPNIISIPSSINAPDGGIDGRVDTASKDSNNGTIKKGLTCYQIKTGYYRIDKAGIRKLFGDKSNLKLEVENCLNNGTLVIVLTGQDLPTEGEKKKIYEYLGWEPRIEIWAQSTLIGYLKRYPKLCLQILKIQDGSFCYYNDWAGQKDMRRDLITSKEQDDFIAGLGQRLRSDASAEHIRITGAHGIGKTRLVLEALRPAELSPLCIYTNNPREFMKSLLFKHLSVRNDGIRAILVVDECTEEHMEDIWRQTSRHGNRIKLVTIYDKTPRLGRHGMKILEVPSLEDTHIKQILESYVGPQYRAGIWYTECKSSPRAAHIIGENLRSNPDDILRQPEASGWDRFIAYRNSITGEAFERRKTVLLWIGQLREFGYAGPYLGVRKIIEDKIKDQEGIEKGAFARTVRELMDMGILHGSDILHIEPNALHAWLWREWYKEYGATESFPLDDMLEKAKTDHSYRNVLMWYVDAWKYDEKSSPRRAVDDVFRPGGLADRRALLDSEFEADLLYIMSKASPGEAVSYLERRVGSLGMDGLQKFNTGRRQAAMILAAAAGCSSLFEKAARMLLLLAGTGSHATDDMNRRFARLFLPAAGPVGWTETPLAKRVPMIREALASETAGCRLAGIRACKLALQTDNFIKDNVDDEAWQPCMGWIPKSWAEYTEYYRSVLDTVRSSLKSFDKPEQYQLSETVLPCIRGLLKFEERHDVVLHDVVLSVLDDMHGGQHVAPELIIATVSDCLAYGKDGMAADLRDKLRRLHDRVVGDSYHGLMRRRIAMNVLSDFKTPKSEREESMKTLAKRSLDDRDALEKEMGWLVTDEAVHGYEFGYVLGQMDDGALFPVVCNALRQSGQPGAAFLGGYLCAVFDRNRGEWEKLVDSLAADPVLYEWVSELAAISGMTDRVAARILELVESKVDPLALRSFTLGMRVCDVPEAVFQKWVGLLADGDTDAYKVALNLYHGYYVHGKRSMPDSVGELLFPRNDPRRILSVQWTTVSFWSDILASYVRQNPDAEDMAYGVVDVVIAGSTNSTLDMELMPALEAAMENNPDKTWGAISALIDPSKNPSIHTYLSVKQVFFVDGGTIFGKIAPASIYGWIDKDAERRAPVMACLLPHDIVTAVEFAAKYGKLDRVKKALIDNQRSDLFTSPWPEHREDKTETVDSLLDKESRPAAREFLQEYRDALPELHESG